MRGRFCSESRKGVSATTASTPAFAWTRASRRPASDARIGRSAGVSAGQDHAPAIRLESKSLERATPGHDLSARGNVAKVDNSGWSLYGAQRSQPVATGSKRDGAENSSLKQEPLPWVATGCRRGSMVRRGSTVRVRQRALQRPANGGLCSQIDLQCVLRAVGMDPVMDPSDEKLSYGVGALADEGPGDRDPLPPPLDRA
jgi:hypothetical protein